MNSHEISTLTSTSGPRKRRNRWTAAVLMGALLTGTATIGAGPAGAHSHTETVVVAVPKAAVASAFNTALGSTEGRIHNLGPRNGTSWLADASTITLPGGTTQSFSIPEYRYDVTKWRKWLYYVNDLRSQEIHAQVEGDRINVVLAFESGGEEIKTKCIRRRLGKWGECTLDVERDIHLDDTVLGISMNPVAHRGSVSFGEAVVDLETDLRIANKLCQAFSKLCKHIEGKIESSLVPTVEGAVRSHLNTAQVRDAVAEAIRGPLETYLGAGAEVRAVTSQGGNYLLTVERDVVIGPDSVKSLTLGATPSSVTGSCPRKVTLKGTLSTKHAVSGTGFVTLNGGQKTPFTWSAGKNQTVSSTLPITVDGVPGQTRIGWATMTVQWTGSDGKTHSKVSDATTFSVSCTASASGSLTL